MSAAFLLICISTLECLQILPWFQGVTFFWPSLCLVLSRSFSTFAKLQAEEARQKAKAEADAAKLAKLSPAEQEKVSLRILPSHSAHLQTSALRALFHWTLLTDPTAFLFLQQRKKVEQKRAMKKAQGKQQKVR